MAEGSTFVKAVMSYSETDK